MMIFLPEWADEFIAKPILWVGPILILEHSFLNNALQSLKKSRSQDIKRGLFVGVIYFCTYTFISGLSYGFPSVNPDHFSFSQILVQALIALSTGCIEELVFRRYLLEKTLSIFNDSTVTNSFIAVLFAFIHLPIILFVYKYPIPIAASYLFLLFLSGFIYGLVYLKNKSLAAAIMTHAVWNFLGTIVR